MSPQSTPLVWLRAVWLLICLAGSFVLRPALSISVNVYSSSDCNANSLQPNYSFAWPDVGPFGGVAERQCVLNTTTLLPPPVNSSAAPTLVNGSLSYACWTETDPVNSTETSFIASVFNPWSTDCNGTARTGNVRLTMQVYALAPGECTSLSGVDSSRGAANASLLLGYYARINCSADASVPIISVNNNGAEQAIHRGATTWATLAIIVMAVYMQAIVQYS